MTEKITLTQLESFLFKAAKLLGINWLNLQSAYDLRRTRQVVGKQIERDVIPHAVS